MRIVENFPPPPPKPLRTFDLMEVTEDELRQLRTLVANTPWSPELSALYTAMSMALDY